MYRYLVVIVLVFMFLGPVDARGLRFGDDTNFVVILECSINDEIQATISNFVLAGEPTDQFRLKTRLSPDILYFNARAGFNMHERFTQICSGVLGGKVTEVGK